MAAENPFSGAAACRDYDRLLAFSAFIVFIHAVLSALPALAEELLGLRFTPLESIAPAMLGTAAASAALLTRLGACWRAALSDWREKFVDDLLKALKYFGGYVVLASAIALLLALLWLLLGDHDMRAVMEPVAAPAAREGVILRKAAAVSAWRLLPSLLTACALAPLAEELFFRRILFVSLRAARGFWFSAGCSAVFFALFHGAAAPLLLPVGFYFCWVYEKERRLPVNVMMHSMVNLVMLGNRLLG